MFFFRQNINNIYGKELLVFLKKINHKKCRMVNLRLHKHQIRAKLYLDNIHVDVHFWDPEISDFTNYIAVKCRKYMNRNVYFDIRNGEIIFFI